MRLLSLQLARVGFALIFGLWLLLGGGCSLYQSPDREFLEANGAIYLSSSSGLGIRVLESCSLIAVEERFTSLDSWSHFSERLLAEHKLLSSWVWIENDNLFVLASEKSSGLACLTKFDLRSQSDIDLAIDDFLFSSGQALIGLLASPGS